MRIVFLPLDERFCTKDYFIMLAKSFNLQVIYPEFLGQKKIPADTSYLSNWLLKNAQNGDILLISIDMLLHGGLIPSRMDLLKFETLLKRLEVLKELKKKNVKIYAVKTLTRIPKYNSSDEEPDYWEYVGKNLYEFSLKLARGLKKSERIPEWIVEDFLWRRKRNFDLTVECINYVEKGIIDSLNIMLDDNSEGSLLSKEAKDLEKYARSQGVSSKVYIRNGADEAMLTVLAKSLTDYFKVTPEFEVFYTFPQSKHLIPPYESFPLYMNVQNHIEACGGQIGSSFDSGVIMYVNNFKGDEKSFEAPFQEEHSTLVNKDVFNKGKIVGISDVRYANGSDAPFVEKLLEMNLDWTKTSYYGWNTPGNTIGSACAHATLQYIAEKKLLKVNEDEMKKYQAVLFLEHFGYQADVRQKLVNEIEKRGLINQSKLPYNLILIEDWAIEFVRKELNVYLEKINNSFKTSWQMEIFFPWHRTFEIGIRLF
ncbi:MAG: DUF4127 family protein [Thermosipho sp. (in: Bacteria)]|nr:DUF4127 family protein [Thermosipho sp. (in: thermotogales)]